MMGEYEQLNHTVMGLQQQIMKDFVRFKLMDIVRQAKWVGKCLIWIKHLA